MKNITVSVDEQTHRLARIRAAELDTSVSALVRDYLRSLVAETKQESAPSQDDAQARLEQRRRSLREVLDDFKARGVGLRMSDNLSRDELYDRARARAEIAEAAAQERTKE